MDESSRVTERPERSGGSSGSTGSSTADAKWELLELLAAVLLAAESLRIVGSVTAGIINGLSSTGVPLGGQRQIGTSMEAAANFSDGPGIVLLLLSLGLLWWRAEYWSGRVRRSATESSTAGDTRGESVQVVRLLALSRWAMVLFVLAAAGAIAYVVGNVLVYSASGISSSIRWADFADDAFSLAYLIIALAGLIGSWRLTSLCEVDAALIAVAD